MQIDCAKHIFNSGTDAAGSLRYIWYLRNPRNPDNSPNIDSFDYNLKEDKIRFYGSTQEYDPDKVPKRKHKLWNILSFRQLINDTRSCRRD